MYSPGRNFVFTIALMQSSRFAAKDGRLRVLVVAAVLVPWLVIGCSAQNPPISEQSVAESRAAGAAAVKLATDFEWGAHGALATLPCGRLRQ
jgi:hypothetical protein